MATDGPAAPFPPGDDEDESDEPESAPPADPPRPGRRASGSSGTGQGKDGESSETGDDAPAYDQEEWARRLAPALEEKRFLHIDRDRLPGNASVNGIPVAMGPAWLVIHEVVDLHLNGYAAIRRRDVSLLRRNRYDRFYEDILRGEGAWPLAGLPHEIDASDTESLFGSLKRHNQWVIVESEDPEEEFFTIGRIVRVGRKSLSVLHFDATGKWERIPTLVPYEGLTMASFGNEYIKTFAKYVTPATPRSPEA